MNKQAESLPGGSEIVRTDESNCVLTYYRSVQDGNSLSTNCAVNWANESDGPTGVWIRQKMS